MNSKTQRISERLIKDLRDVGLERINKGISDPFKKKELSLREMTEQITKTKSWKEVLREMKQR